MNPTITSVLLAFFFGWFFWQLYGRFGALAKMASEGRWDRPWRRLGLVFSIGLGQSKLVGPRKERRAGVMHAFIFWGALLVGLREMILMGEGFVEGFQELLPGLGADSPLAYGYVALVNGAELAVAYMVGVALYRRLVKRYARLDLNWQGIYVLLFIMGIVTTDLAYDAVRYALAAQGGAVHLLQSPVWGSEVDWAPVSRLLAGLVSGLGADWLDGLRQGLFWGHLVIMLSFLNVLPNTKQFHELTALPNVFFGALNRPHAPIPRLDLEDEQAWEAGAVGVNRLEQLTWKQGLDFLSCTECGRCYDSCPTYLTGKPLTQKWFNQSLLAYFKEEQANLLKTGKAGEAKTLVGDVISPDTLWACTTCRACEEACPVSIEHVPRVIGMRQGQTLMGEAYPPEMANAFKGLERNGNPWGIGYDQRADWARDEPVTILDGPVTEEVEVVMWVGCMGAYDKRNQKVAKATAALLTEAGVTFAILGTREKCNGDLARRAGNEFLFQTLAAENAATLNGAGVKQVVTACPHCLNSLKHEYPQMDGRYEVFHHSQYIQKLIAEGRLTPKPVLDGITTFHDPCYLGRYNNEYSAPRALLAASAKLPPVEMGRSKNSAMCCGAGGGRMFMEETLGTRINQERVRQAGETGAATIVTACPFCMTMLEDGLKSTGKEDSVKVLDIAEITLKAVQG